MAQRKPRDFDRRFQTPARVAATLREWADRIAAAPETERIAWDLRLRMWSGERDGGLTAIELQSQNRP